ncbi:MAG: hypothetical protein P0Y56_14365 [Candidatus Andeanibacterium colombiense]|uniref:Uncharacterized protein n=1 Tax=Candidatus Andeanibacterium colombiense TaxID=3121345 RepID=A0AAJ5X5A8_9SPHN|nr:MAG: hypothetical protein P0Y56_14365 [Sphingomonadaceae bacterium]
MRGSLKTVLLAAIVRQRRSLRGSEAAQRELFGESCPRFPSKESRFGTAGGCHLLGAVQNGRQETDK